METSQGTNRASSLPDFLRAEKPAQTPATTPTTVVATADQALVTALMKSGILTADQLESATRYGQENNRDLRQSILELGILTGDRINALAFEHIAAMGGNGGLAVASQGSTSLSPDVAKHQRDIRNELRDLAGSAPLSDLVIQIVSKAIESRATDIHFDPQENGLRIRYRVDGQLLDILTLDNALITPVVSRIKVMSNLNIVERKHAQDGRITVQHAGRPRDLRIATMPTALGEKLVIRVHESLGEGYSFEHLGMTAEQSELLTGLVAKPYGAILVAGPVGAGKTSTLYSCLGKVNQPARNIMTIEDPIEHRIPGVNQMQTDPRGDMGFGDGLKAMLRQDPDVIMIGEIRDEETAKIGIRAALTGVLVFSSIHASDSPGTISNLSTFGIPGYQLSSSLLAVVSQRLIRKICPYCRVAYPADAKAFAALDLDPAEYEGLTLHRGVGCPACFQTGYLGRTGVFEIMDINETMRELIFQQIPKDILRRVAVDLGMRTLKMSAVAKVLEGTTTVEEVYRVIAI